MTESNNEDLNDLIEFLVRELAINDWKKGLSIAQLLDRVEVFYNNEERRRKDTEQDAPGEVDPEHPQVEDGDHLSPWRKPIIDHDFVTRVWETLTSREDVIVGDNRPGNCEITLDQALALPEEEIHDEPAKGVKGGKTSAPKQPVPSPSGEPDVVYQPRIHVAQRRLWLVLTGHDVDKAKLPFSEWQLLLAIVAAGKNGILQADAGKQTGQDKRSVPRRTDFLFQKGYIDKKQVLAHSQKTSLLTHKMFLEDPTVKEDIPDPSKLPASVLTQDLKPVPGHEYWTGAFVDTEMVARAALAVIRAWGVIRRTHILAKMNITDLRLRKTLERTMRKFFELKVAKRVSAILPDNPKIFKDCVKFLREPTEEEWAHFKKRLTSQGFKNRPSRAKPKSEHKSRVRKRASVGAKKKKKTVLDDSSDDFVEEDAEDSDEVDDFFGGDDGDETFDATAKPTLMTSTKASKEELENMVKEAIEAIPGVDGVTEDDLLAEIDGVSAEDLHALFVPLDDSIPRPAEIRLIHLVREPIQKARQDTFQYYTLTDFKRRVRSGDSSWEGVSVARFEPASIQPPQASPQQDQLAERQASIAELAGSKRTPSRAATPKQPVVKSAKGRKKAAVALTSLSASGSSREDLGFGTPSGTTRDVTAPAVKNPFREVSPEQEDILSRKSSPVVSSAAPTPGGTPADTPQATPKGPPSIRLRPLPKKPPGRPKRPGEEHVSFTSHDQVQREAGVPGAYMDIPEFTKKLRGPPSFLPKGQRKAKKFMVMLKSNRINELDLSHREPKPHIVFDPVEESTTPKPPSRRNQRLSRAVSSESMATPGVDISTPAETPNRSFLGLMGAHGSAYQSPYQANPSEPSTGRPASPQLRSPLPPYVSSPRAYNRPYNSTEKRGDSVEPGALDFVVPATPISNQQSATQAYETPYFSTPSVKQSSVRASARRASKIATERLHATAAQEYQSPYATLPNDTAASPNDEVVVQPAARRSISRARGNDEDEGDVVMADESPKAVQPVVRLSEEQLKLDNEITKAANEIFPDQAVQLPVSKDGVIGNLCVDMDSTKLVFFPLDIMDMDSKIDMDASLITEVVMEEEAFKLVLTLRSPVESDVPARLDDNDTGTTNNRNTMLFAFASTSVHAAKSVRSKIAWGIAARALKAKREALPVWAFPVPGGGPKPFVCDTCGGLWKNYEGIKYHKTKSKVPCNASYVRPPTPQPGEGKKKRKKGYVSLDEIPADEAARIASGRQQDALSEERAVEAPIVEGEGRPTRRTPRHREPKSFQGMDARQGSESQESDYREKRPSKSPKKPPSKPIKTAASKVVTKAPVPEEISAATPEKRVLLAAKAKFKYPTTNDRDNVERRTGPVVTQQRKDILMELVEANGGAFPGDQGLWFAMHAAWMERYPHSNIQDYKYCNQAVALLEDQGMLTKLKFSFRDQKGRMRTRAVVTKMGVDPLSPEVAAIKEKIKENFPRYYCPPEYAPPQDIMSMLEGRESRPSEEERQRRQLEKEQQEDPKVRQQKEEQALQEARVVSNATEVAHPINQRGGARRRRASSSDQEIAFLSAPFYHPEPDAEGETDKDHRRPRTTKQKEKAEKTYRRSSSFREEQSMRMKALWASLKERGSSLKDIKTNDDLYLGENALIIEESDDEEEGGSRALDPVLGMFSHALMQRADGSWGAEREPSKPWMLPKKPAESLPEPVTYMQLPETSEWAFRPFGHGADPIYAKPSKQLPRQKELCSRDSSFRPIIISTRRLHGGRRHPLDSKQGTKRVRSWHWNRAEDGPKKRARKTYHPLPEGGMFAYGHDEKTGEEIPWPDFKPISLPPGRGIREHSIMPEWSSNPGLASLLDHQKATQEFAQASLTRGHSAQRPSDEPLTENEDTLMQDGDKPPELLSSATALPKEELPTDLEAILDLAKQSGYCNVPSNEDPMICEIDTVCAWERSIRGKKLLMMGSAEPGTIFINHTLDHEQSLPPTTLVWAANNHFTLETLPYQLLAYNPLENFYPPMPKPKRAYVKRAKRQDPAAIFHGMQEATATDFEEISSYNGRKRRLQDTYGNGEPRTKRVYRRAAQTKDFRVRRLTCLPMDIEGLALPEDDPNFAIQVSTHNNTGHRKRTNERNVVSDAMDDRLIVSVVVIRTLLGGLDQSVDWVLVSRLFPQCTMNWLHRHFNLLADKNVKRVEKLVEDFQDLYLKAYTNGELPPLDYDHTLDYDWDTLIDWTMDRTQALATANVNLPASRESFNKAFEIHDTEERIFRDSYFNSALPVHKRIAHATAKNAILPLKPPVEPTVEDKEESRRIARSWARASTLTPAATFDAATTAVKLHSVTSEIMGDAIGQLLNNKVLMPVNKGRPVPGRGFEVTDVFTAAFSRLLSRAHFDEAAEFKRKLDDAFRKGRAVTLEYTASEGEIMATTNLQAHGRIILNGRNVPDNKFGLTDGNYQTRRMDKTRLLFDIDLTPSPSYVYDAEHPLAVSGALDVKSHPPPRPLDSAIPLWYDINDEVILGLWKKTVALVLSVIMNRTGADTKEVTRLCKPVLEEWEVKLFIEWAYNMGIVKEVGPGTGIEGWTVTEWWWWVAGQI